MQRNNQVDEKWCMYLMVNTSGIVINTVLGYLVKTLDILPVLPLDTLFLKMFLNNIKVRAEIHFDWQHILNIYTTILHIYCETSSSKH